MRGKGVFGISVFLSMSLLAISFLLACSSSARPSPTTPAASPKASPTPTTTVASPSVSPIAKPSVSPSVTPIPTVANVPFYQRKTITLIVTSGVGGGPDFDARAWATFLEKSIPGNPRVMVENRDAGGGAVAMHYFLETVKHDGLNVVVTTGGTIKRWLTKASGHDYDLSKTTMLLTSNVSQAWSVSSRMKIRNVKDLIALGKPVVTSHTALDSTQAVAERFIAPLLGFQVKQVAGYSSSGESRMAVLKGEADMWGGSTNDWRVSLVPLVEKGDLIPLFQDGIGWDMARGPAVPDIPTVAEVYQQIYNKPLSGKEWDNFRTYVNLQITRPVLVQTDAPAEAIEALKVGIKGMLASADFKEYALVNIGSKDADTGFLSGDIATKAWQNFLATSPEVIALIK